MLLLISSLSHRNRKEEKETDGKAGEWRARDTMLTPFLLLLSPSTFVSLPPLCFLSSNPQNARELRLTISLTILYTSAAEQWRTTTKNSGNRGTALLLLGVAPACPSILIGLQRLTGAKETAGRGEGGRFRET